MDSGTHFYIPVKHDKEYLILSYVRNSYFEYTKGKDLTELAENLIKKINKNLEDGLVSRKFPTHLSDLFETYSGEKTLKTLNKLSYRRFRTEFIKIKSKSN